MSGDTFKIDGNVVVCTSASGSVYQLTENSCTCKGFSFRRNCRHLKQATESGIFKRLKKGFSALHSPYKGSFRRSPYIMKERIKAVRAYLEKNGFNNPSGNMLHEVEKIVTPETQPGTVLALAKKIEKSEKKG